MSRANSLKWASWGLGGLIASAVILIVVVHERTCTCQTPLKAADISTRLKTPRTALRTFYSSISASNRDPERIDDAVACLDLSKMPHSFHHDRDAGRLATHLDVVLRVLGIRSFLANDNEEGPPCVLTTKEGFRLVLARGADGCWRFDSDTMRQMPAMRVAVLQLEAAKSEPAASDVPGEYRSPRATYQTFQDALHRGDYEAAGHSLDLSPFPAPAREALGPILAVKIQEIADRMGVLLEQDLPDTATGDPIQLIARREGRIGIERQSSGERKGQWLFSPTTVRSVETLYDAMATLPISEDALANGRNYLVPPFQKSPGLWVRHHLPRWSWLRLHLGKHGTVDGYQIAGLGLIVLVSLIVRALAIQLGSVTARQVQRMRGQMPESDWLVRLLPPLGWLVAIMTISAGVQLLDLRHSLAVWTFTAISLLQWAAVSWVIYCVMDVGLNVMAARRQSHNTSSQAAITDMLFPMVALLLRIGVVIATGLALLQMFEMNVATILAGLGIGGLAFALAAQDSLKNFFGSLTLIFDRTFCVGDLVKIGEKEGKVEAVGLRSTRIRALDDALMTIPNAELTTMHVTNYGARRYRKLRTSISVEYSTPPEKIEAFCAGIVDLIEAHPNTRKEEFGVHVCNLSDSAIEILVNVFFLTNDSKLEMQAKDSLTLDIIRLAQSLGIVPASSSELGRQEWAREEAVALAKQATANVPAPHFRRAGQGVVRTDRPGS